MSDSRSDARAASQTVPSSETQAEPGVRLGLAAPTSTARAHTRPPPEPDRPQTWHYGLVAQWWAEFSEVQPTELAFYQGCIMRFGQPALDLACGTGRLLIPLLQAGLDVDGCDLSEDMLAHCRAKAAQAGLTTALYAQPMHALALPRRYRTIFICDSFGIGGQRQQDAEALGRCYDALEPGGALVFSHYLPYVATPWWPYWLPEQRPHLPMPWPELTEPRLTADGTALQLQARLVVLDPLEQRSTQQIHARRWRDGQVVAEEEYLLTSSQYFLHELELLLTQAGFDEITVSAGYTNEAVTAAHAFIVYTARKSALERQERT
jgi:SAM-dependent methyltransferase